MLIHICWSSLQRLAVTLDHSALWAIAASFEELRGKTGDAVKRAVPQSKVPGPTSLQSAIENVGPLLRGVLKRAGARTPDPLAKSRSLSADR
jgi:hypothetical protein